MSKEIDSSKEGHDVFPIIDKKRIRIVMNSDGSNDGELT
jgi:hypothetical protein